MGQEEKQKRQFAGRHRAAIIVAAALALVVVISTFLIVKFVNYQASAIHQDKAAALVEIADKTGEIVNIMEETYFPVTEIIARGLKNEAYADEADVVRLMNDVTEPLLDGGITTLLVDAKASYLCSDGHSGHWTDIAELVNSIADNGIYIGTIPHLGSEQQFIFFACENRVTIPTLCGETAYIMVAVDLDTFSSKLVVDSFGSDGYTYIIRDDGRVLFKQTQLDGRRLIDSYNIFSALKEYEFSYSDSVEELQRCVNAGIGTACEFTFKDGTQYFVANSSLFRNNWTILLFAKSDVLGSGMDNAVHVTIIYIVGLALFIFLSAGTAIFILIREKRRHEREENERILALNVQLADAVEVAEEASRAKTEFLSNMSHDIRTPINGIMGMTAIALKQDNPEKTDDCLSKIETASAHLFSLINDVLDMSRIERGKTEIAHKSMNLKELLTGCGVIIKGQMNDRTLNYVEEFDGITHPYVLGDELHLRQIFINILGNAVKFTPDAGTITVTVTELEQNETAVKYRFAFRDTGIGMKKDFLSKIFTPFAQEDNGSRTNYKGTGLGMAITKQFVELMNGSIEVESEYGKGSCFMIDLTFDIDHETAARLEQPTGPVDISGMQILLVEDNELNMEIATDLLQDEGAIVTVAEDGLVAVDTFSKSEENHFDVILMDIMMPNMNGYDATRAIRALDRADASTVPIIAMSANAFEEDVRKSLESGMNAHLAKPIKIKLLMEELGEFVRKISNHGG